jgi:hypothetical protein
MLLKLLFTLLAIVWLYQALRPLLFPQKTPPPQPPPPPAAGQENRVVQKSRYDDDGDYIDYEEIK